MLHKLVGMFVLLVSLTSWGVVGCQPGRFTDDRRYVGNPERPEATSEPTRAENDDLRQPTQADHE
ncbi:MAG: hypothetical protein AB7P24_15230 [Nitrospira sp.]